MNDKCMNKNSPAHVNVGTHSDQCATMLFQDECTRCSSPFLLPRPSPGSLHARMYARLHITHTHANARVHTRTHTPMHEDCLHTRSLTHSRTQLLQLVCWLIWPAGRNQAGAQTRVYSTHARMHARTHTRTHTRTHARTHACRLFAHMRADTFQDPVAAVGLLANLPGRQESGRRTNALIQHARTHARTHAHTHAHTHTRTHTRTHARTHACRLFAHMRADTFQTRLSADLAGRQVGRQAHKRAYTQHARTQARTYKQHADARTHAQTHERMHACTTYARVAAQDEQIPTGIIQLGKNRLRR
jgi:hypothetical protein